MGADINHTFERQTPLMFAVVHGVSDFDLMDIANTPGIDLDQGDEFNTPLLHAIKRKHRYHTNCHDESADTLLDAGASIQEVKEGSPLIRAIEEKRPKFVGRLLKQEASIQDNPRSGLLLRLVLEMDDHDVVHEIVSALVSAGADVDATFEGTPLICEAVSRIDKCYYDALYVDNHRHKHRIANLAVLLRQHYDVDKVDLDGNSALILACRLENKDYRTELTEMLVDKVVDVHIANNEGQTALISPNLRPTDILMLLDHNADLDAIDKNNQTALHVAVHDGNPHMVEMLLQNGINSSTRDSSSHTARWYPEFIKAEGDNITRGAILSIFACWTLEQSYVYNRDKDLYIHT